MDEEKAVEEFAGVSPDEQSAAWREVAREAVRNATQLGWAVWLYLMARLIYELALAWMAIPA